VKTLFDYQVVCRQDDNGSFVAYVPAIDGCHAIGRTPEEAQQELHNVFTMIAEEHVERGQTLPNDVELAISVARKWDWATPKPLGYFTECHDQDEIEESNWFAAHGLAG